MSDYILYNKDCMDAFKDIADCSIDCVVTDPPYRCISGGNAQKENQPKGMLSKTDGKLFKHNDIKPEVWFPEVYRVLKNGSQCYIMTNTLNMEKYLTLAREIGFGLHSILVWEKNNVTPSRWYMKNGEFVLFLRKGKAKTINNVGSKMVHQFDNIIGSKVHPTEKPVELMQLYIENSTSANETVLDPFMGSGSTGVAALKLGRKFIGFEIDEEYFKIAEGRIKDLGENKGTDTERVVSETAVDVDALSKLFGSSVI